MKYLKIGYNEVILSTEIVRIKIKDYHNMLDFKYIGSHIVYIMKNGEEYWGKLYPSREKAEKEFNKIVRKLNNKEEE